ncbi:MAG: hypothetical protein R3B54_12110 [Bdellovibrionota bacterium]
MDYTRKKYYLFIFILSLVLLVTGCSNENSDENLLSSFYCSVSASVSSGDINASYSSVQLSNLTVYTYNGSGSYYYITLPDGYTATSSSSSYTYPSTLSLTTESGGGIYEEVYVVDSTTGTQTSCSLILSSSSTTSSGVVSVYASSTSVTKGTSITVTASASSVSNPVFYFEYEATYPYYISVSNSSNGVLTITSSVAQTVVVTAVMESNSSGVSTDSADITLYFNESGSSSSGTAYAYLSASPSSSVAVGSTVTLYATVSGISDPVYTFYFSGTNNLSATAYQSGSTGTVTSSTAGSTIIGVRVVSASNSSLYATATKTITFSGSSSGLTCTLTKVSGTYYRNSPVTFVITSNTGEKLRLTAWEPGEAWDNGAPSFPLSIYQNGVYNYFYGTYSYTGSKTVRVIAESVSRPGTYCNSGAYLSTSLYIY